MKEKMPAERKFKRQLKTSNEEISFDVSPDVIITHKNVVDLGVVRAWMDPYYCTDFLVRKFRVRDKSKKAIIKLWGIGEFYVWVPRRHGWVHIPKVYKVKRSICVDP